MKKNTEKQIQETTQTVETTSTEKIVDTSWKRYLLPELHPEGWKIMAMIAGLVFLVGLTGCFKYGFIITLPLLIAAVAIYLNPSRELYQKIDNAITAVHPQGWKLLTITVTGIVLLAGLVSLCWSWFVGLPVLVFGYYFFRNPTRETPQTPNLIIAPADGIVLNIKDVVPPKELGLGDEPLQRISIFMSVFNVHINRSPVTGTVDALHYREGKLVSVADKDSEDNERQEICVVAENGQRIGFVQIAGLVARRIYCPLQIGDKLQAGQIFGLIRFGSRLDVFLPKGVQPKVLLGQIAVAGETVLADMNELNK